MRQVFLDLEKSRGKTTCSFVGEVPGENLIVNLAMPRDFFIPGAEYYLVTENRKENETMFLSLLAKNGNTLIFSLPPEVLHPPTVKFTVGAYGKENEEVYIVKESGAVYLFLAWSESDFREAKK